MPALRARYPRLRAVGEGDTPAGPAAPLRPRVVEGVDFAFARVCGGEPARWPGDAPILVRPIGPSLSGESVGAAARNAARALHGAVTGALETVLDELRELTGLQLVRAEPDPTSSLLRVDGEIRVLVAVPDGLPEGSVAGCAAGCIAREMPGSVAGSVAGGSAARAATGSVLVSGFAVIDPARCAATATPVAAVFRHGLGHALGLHHANRFGCVMSRESRAITWAAGDRAGLFRVGVGRPVSVSARQTLAKDWRAIRTVEVQP